MRAGSDSHRSWAQVGIVHLHLEFQCAHRSHAFSDPVNGHVLMLYVNYVQAHMTSEHMTGC